MSVWENLQGLKGLNVLNLFAGMEVGRLACERAGVPIDKYYSSEIDKYAIQVSKANWPDIIHLGDVTKVYGCTLPDIHLLLGGSPCQGFSFAGKQLNFNDPRSALLFEYVRILKELREFNPNIYFLLENVMMKKEYQDVISELLGVQPIMINSALVSAQNRKRLYWTNIPFLGQPADKGIILKDILETSGTGFNANRHIYSQDGKAPTLISSTGGHKAPKVEIQAGRIVGRKINPETNKRDDYNPDLIAEKRLEINSDPSKTNCLTTVDKDNVIVLENYSERCQKQILKNSKTEDEKAISLCANANATGSGVNIFKNGFTYRKLTVTECERLQTVPDGYTQRLSATAKQISNTQAYKMLGNGWTTDVIAHLLLPLGDYSCLF